MLNEPARPYVVYQGKSFRSVVKMFEWSNDYLMGNPIIDDEHRMLFGLIYDFENARLTGASKIELRDVLQEIVLYTKFHFVREENILKKVKFPELEKAQSEHLKFMDLLNNKMLSHDLDRAKPDEVSGFLQNWFIEHVTVEDAKYSTFIPPQMWQG